MTSEKELQKSSQKIGRLLYKVMSEDFPDEFAILMSGKSKEQRRKEREVI